MWSNSTSKATILMHDPHTTFFSQSGFKVCMRCSHVFMLGLRAMISVNNMFGVGYCIFY